MVGDLPDATCDPFQRDFEDFFEHTRNGYIIATPAGTILQVNARLAGWLECAAAELKDKRFSDLLTISGKIYYETHLAPLLRMQGYVEEIALELVSQKGERLPVIVNALESCDEAGSPLFMRFTVFKSRERRQYERDLLAARNELRELNASLAERVAAEVKERLAAEGSLSNERHIAKLREQFIAVLGHDLRNPLASIIAGLKILSATPSNERARAVAVLMQKSATRMAGIIDDVMDFARGRLGGGISLNRRRVLLEPTLSDVVEELRTAWPERVITTSFALPEPVYCDPPRLCQLLSNLIGNALTHGAEDGVVAVRAFVQGHAFELSVSNPGDPIPPAALERLFEPFTREDLRPSQQGLGLGLYIASEIARAHGGKMMVASSKVETRFTFLMPISSG